MSTNVIRNAAIAAFRLRTTIYIVSSAVDKSVWEGLGRIRLDTIHGNFHQLQIESY